MRPFIDETGSIDTDEIWLEAVPLAKLVGLFVGISLVPLAIGFLGAGSSAVGALLTVLAQFVLAVGAGIVLMYVVVRGIELSGRSDTAEAGDGED